MRTGIPRSRSLPYRRSCTLCPPDAHIMHAPLTQSYPASQSDVCAQSAFFLHTPDTHVLSDGQTLSVSLHLTQFPLTHNPVMHCLFSVQTFLRTDFVPVKTSLFSPNFTDLACAVKGSNASIKIKTVFFMALSSLNPCSSQHIRRNNRRLLSADMCKSPL